MKKSKTIYICLFALLYLCVGFVSTIHAVSFFSLANVTGLAVMLAIAFEIGQAAVLFDILTNPNDRKKFMPWALMCLLTFVQVLGNVFSSYKYLITNSVADLKYFKDPIFVWATIPDNMANVILTYLIGGLLPIVSLALSEMVTSRLSEDDNKEPPKQDLENELDIVEESVENYKENDDHFIEPNNTEPPIIENTKEIKGEEQPEQTITQTQPKQNSHFINL